MMKNYDDIINMKHHESKIHKRMSVEDRAAQFAPFAALTGYAEAINESGRLVEKKKELTDEEIDVINNKIQYVLNNKDVNVIIVYFIPDDLKNGGKYVSVNGYLKYYDQINKMIILQNKLKIKIDDILSIECSEFDKFIY